MSKVKEYVTKDSQLCWDCNKACGGCSWSRDFIPVPGWKAVPTKILQCSQNGSGKARRYCCDSYEIYECPEFEPLIMSDEKEFLKLMMRNVGRIRRD
jgi:hypothetical protein